MLYEAQLLYTSKYDSSGHFSSRSYVVNLVYSWGFVEEFQSPEVSSAFDYIIGATNIHDESL